MVGLDQITIVPLITVIFQLLIFFMLTSSFTFQSGIHIKLPKTITSDVLKEQNFVITITSEDLIYVNNHIMTIKELKGEMSKPSNKTRPVLIKAARRTSVGRIVDVWDLCRGVGVERINIATNQDTK